jgi:hypothetical protein
MRPDGGEPVPGARLFGPEPPEQQDHRLGSMLSKAMPEFSVFIIVAIALRLPDVAAVFGGGYLEFAVFADGATLMMSATLIDVASRLRRRPPGWLAALIAIGILVLYPETFTLLGMAWSLGLWTLLPFAWSIVERLRALWTLPSASKLEKIRRRTLTFDRLYVALIVAFCALGVMLVHAALNDGSFDPALTQRLLPWALLMFYGIATFNAWRVHQPAFARRPRSLLPWIDQGQANYLDPL